MMANATKAPFWRARVATELDRNPHLSKVINDECTRCHAPIANYEINKVQGGDIGSICQTRSVVEVVLVEQSTTMLMVVKCMA